MINELLNQILDELGENLPEYGTIKIDTYQGKVSFVEVNTKHKIQTFKNN